MSENSRREFMKIAAGSAVAGVVGWDAGSYSRILGANDRIQVGIVGYSERFNDGLLPAFLKHAESQNCEIVAVSDIWKLRREEGVAKILEKTGKTIAAARNNDELYAMKNVDAVIISTADHQHAFHCIEAVRAGRDVYVEKPLANTMKDARDVLKAVKQTDRVVQIGTQRRSSRNAILAKEYLASGEFGAINMIELATNANQPRRWRRPLLLPSLRQEDTDWNRFLVGRTKDKYDPHKYLEYRLYWPYSSGIPCQWMTHSIDLVHHITGLAHPRNVVVSGGIYQWRDGRINPDTMTAVFEYGDDPKKTFQVLFSSRMSNSIQASECLVYSKDGVYDVASTEVSPEGGLTERYAKDGWKATTLVKKKLADTPQPEMVQAHMLNWTECLRSRKSPNANIDAGYNHSVALCMTIAALHSGNRVTFDNTKQDVVV